MQGKLQILSAVLRLDRPFRPPHIVDMTGLDRQLVRYHLSRLCESGYLEKIDKSYVVKDKEGLLSTLIDSADSVSVGLPSPSGFFNKEMTDFGNFKAECLVAARTLDLPMSEAQRIEFLNKIDASMKQLKQWRKYMTNSTKTVGSAQKYFKKAGGTDPEWVGALWKVLIKDIEHIVDINEFEDAYKAALVEEE